MSRAVHCLLVPHGELQIAMFKENINYNMSTRNITIRVKQLLPFHPLTHVQVSGAVHSSLVPQGELQIAVLRGNNS